MEVVRASIQVSTALNLANTKSADIAEREELARLAELVQQHPNPEAYAYATLTRGARQYRFRIGKDAEALPKPICLN